MPMVMYIRRNHVEGEVLDWTNPRGEAEIDEDGVTPWAGELDGWRNKVAEFSEGFSFRLRRWLTNPTPISQTLQTHNVDRGTTAKSGIRGCAILRGCATIYVNSLTKRIVSSIKVGEFWSCTRWRTSKLSIRWDLRGLYILNLRNI